MIWCHTKHATLDSAILISINDTATCQMVHVTQSKLWTLKFDLGRNRIWIRFTYSLKSQHSSPLWVLQWAKLCFMNQTLHIAPLICQGYSAYKFSWAIMSQPHFLFFPWSKCSGSCLNVKPRVNSASLSLLPTPSGIYRPAQRLLCRCRWDFRSTHSLIGARCRTEASALRWRVKASTCKQLVDCLCSCGSKITQQRKTGDDWECGIARRLFHIYHICRYWRWLQHFEKVSSVLQGTLLNCQQPCQPLNEP